ncbi:hypothetical protein BGY98DRAFT_1100434 [Russula aff. rugulosa BPL654]|nr:hypothetical protein BGY98DRAFT_1100434 [Russula aff. rugulosa BPL654]
MSLGSQDGANTGQTDQLYYVPVSAQYPSSTYDSTYPTSNLGTQGPVSYILLPGLRTGYATATNATSGSGYGNPGYAAPGSNSNVVYLTSPNSQSIPQVVAAYPNTTSVPSVSQTKNKTYPNRLLVISPSANGSSYNTPQSSQGSVPSASISNSGVAARWDGQSYQKTTVTTGPVVSRWKLTLTG